MSVPSAKYIDKVIRWSYGQFTLEQLGMTADQMFRARLCMEAYRVFTENPSVPVRRLVTNIAARDYETLMQQAELGNSQAAATAAALGIARDPDTGTVTPRRSTEIANDIYVVNQLAGRLNVSKRNIHKAMYEDNISWLMEYGRKTGTWQAVKQANQDLARINDDFKEDSDPLEQMPGTQLNITGDVSVVKEGRETLSDEERERLRRKWGLTEKELAVQMEEINGVWQAVGNSGDTEDAEDDIWVAKERETQQQDGE
jgi:hypothetical protein